MQSNRGITLPEMLVVVGIVTLLAALSFTSYNSFTQRQAVGKSADEAGAVISEARSLTVSSKGATTYGAHLASTTITMFTGSTYSAAASTNKVLKLDGRVAITNVSLTGGGTDIVFDKLTGATSQDGTFRITLTASTTQYRLITIYKTGVVEVQ